MLVYLGMKYHLSEVSTNLHLVISFMKYPVDKL
jgi:hypothetical protein